MLPDAFPATVIEVIWTRRRDPRDHRHMKKQTINPDDMKISPELMKRFREVEATRTLPIAKRLEALTDLLMRDLLPEELKESLNK
jgi:hypothetical protein